MIDYIETNKVDPLFIFFFFFHSLFDSLLFCSRRTHIYQQQWEKMIKTMISFHTNSQQHLR